MVIINTDSNTHHVTLPVQNDFIDGTELQDQLGDLHVTVKNGSLEDLTIHPQTAIILA